MRSGRVRGGERGRELPPGLRGRPALGLAARGHRARETRVGRGLRPFPGHQPVCVRWERACPVVRAAERALPVATGERSPVGTLV